MARDPGAKRRPPHPPVDDPAPAVHGDLESDRRAYPATISRMPRTIRATMRHLSRKPGSGRLACRKPSNGYLSVQGPRRVSLTCTCARNRTSGSTSSAAETFPMVRSVILTSAASTFCQCRRSTPASCAASSTVSRRLPRKTLTLSATSLRRRFSSGETVDTHKRLRDSYLSHHAKLGARSATFFPILSNTLGSRYVGIVEAGESMKSRATDDRPLTADELEDLISGTARELGWSRQRVIEEGVLRLWAARHDSDFEPVTPEPDDPPASGRRYHPAD